MRSLDDRRCTPWESKLFYIEFTPEIEGVVDIRLKDYGKGKALAKMRELSHLFPEHTLNLFRGDKYIMSVKQGALLELAPSDR